MHEVNQDALCIRGCREPFLAAARPGGADRRLMVASAMNDPRESIQAEQSVPPWERPGCFRLDGEPHRGNLLWALAVGCFLFSLLASIPFLGSVLGLISIMPCFVIRQMARRDLARMRTGLVDPRGRSITTFAEELARDGFWFGIGATLFWATLYLVFWLLPMALARRF